MTHSFNKYLSCIYNVRSQTLDKWLTEVPIQHIKVDSDHQILSNYLLQGHPGWHTSPCTLNTIVQGLGWTPAPKFSSLYNPAILATPLSWSPGSFLASWLLVFLFCSLATPNSPPFMALFSLDSSRCFWLCTLQFNYIYIYKPSPPSIPRS